MKVLSEFVRMPIENVVIFLTKNYTIYLIGIILKLL
jgi:hypothetical protein